MLTTSHSSNPDIETLIKDLIREDFAFEQTCRRSASRENFVRPVSVVIGDEPAFLSFSKNFSFEGIGLICNREVKEGQSGELSIYRLKDSPVRIHAECRWCREFGPAWYLSGWRFLAKVK